MAEIKPGSYVTVTINGEDVTGYLSQIVPAKAPGPEEPDDGTVIRRSDGTIWERASMWWYAPGSEVDYTWDDVTGGGHASFDILWPKPEPSGPRVFSVGDRIPEDVTHLVDSDGDHWTRESDMWVSHSAELYATDCGLLEYAPLTEVI